MPKKRISILILLSTIILCTSVFLAPKIINPFHLDDTTRSILLFIRLPRVTVAFLMRMPLGASGAVLQGILRNPLADPYILGISSGAALAAAFGLLSGIYLFGKFSIPFAAFIGASVASIMVGAFGWMRGRLL